MSKQKMIAECRLLAESHTVSKVSEHKVHDLAQLMVDAYKGTTDWEEGDDDFDYLRTDFRFIFPQSVRGYLRQEAPPLYYLMRNKYLFSIKT